MGVANKMARGFPRRDGRRQRAPATGRRRCWSDLPDPRFLQRAAVCFSVRSRYRMNFHEYQAKELFAQYGIAVPPGKIANSPDAAVDAAKHLGGSQWMVKAQIHAGGRGKSGGA
ncbi:MAG: hypothetical protein WDW38_000335 [Sanguina aurantia]